MIDGGPRAEPKRKLIAWLVTDDRGELIREIRKLARARGLEPIVGGFSSETLSIEPKEVVHTSHPTFGYLIRFGDNKVVWAPEFFSFPAWAKGADLMFAEASGWNRPIYFRGGVGGHACVEQISKEARKYKIKRLIFAHIGRPSIRALDAGRQPAFGSLAAMALFIAWRTGKTQPRLPKVPGESYALSGETSLPASFPARPKP